MNKVLACLMACCCGAWAAVAMGVSTSHWTQGNEADFDAGTLHNVVVTNLGDVKLSRAVQIIAQEDPKVTSVNALASVPDGTLYAGTGTKGVLLAVKDDKVSVAATIGDAVNILCLAADQRGGLLIGTGGAKGKVYRIDKPGDSPRDIFSADGVQYVWAVAQTPDGEIYAGTGPNGQVFQIDPDGSHTELYKSDQNNVISLISDGKDLLYLGTDPDGLVIRLDRKTKQPFILYNAAEAEITALALDDAGNLFAATGEVVERQQPPENPANKENSGRPENDATGAPIPPNPSPQPPKPPELPNPNPGEPKPIPKSHSQLGVGAMEPKMMDDEPGGPGDNPGAPGGGEGPPSAPLATTAPRPGTHQPPTPPTNPAEQRPPGNAVYKIDKDGFVTEIFRQDVVIYCMLVQGQVLLVGTGPEGKIFQLDPAGEETQVLAKADAKQVMCLLAVKDGRICMGLANTGGICAMTSGYASEGTYISPVLDATQSSRFGNMQLHGQLPDGTTLKVSWRSGNVKDAEAAGWSSWSPEADAAQYVKVAAPSARFVQYRLTFATTDPTKTPLVNHVDVGYQMPNLAPVIKSVKIGTESDVTGPGGAGPAGGAAAGGAALVAPPVHAADAAKSAGGSGVQTITWDASDPNGDSLTYTLYFRLERNGPWILLKDKLKDTSFDWDTRSVADGRYQIKVVASDAASNPPGQAKTASRLSNSFVVDNTPPTIGDLVFKVSGKDVQIDLRVQDRTSVIANVEYTVDSAEDWQAVLPVDGIFDSPDESVTFTVKGLTPGAHQITIRATDGKGNQALQTIAVKIESGS